VAWLFLTTMNMTSGWLVASSNAQAWETDEKDQKCDIDNFITSARSLSNRKIFIIKSLIYSLWLYCSMNMSELEESTKVY
jgi:hypothetical protein